ncbi:MAG: hypothetical protein RCG15_05900 [Candidatus Rickettsia vulgarisii]
MASPIAGLPLNLNKYSGGSIVLLLTVAISSNLNNLLPIFILVAFVNPFLIRIYLKLAVKLLCC